MRHVLKIIITLVLCGWTVVAAQTEPAVADSIEIAPALLPPAPVTNLQAADTDNDHGHSITLTWTKSADHGAGANTVISYRVYRWFPTEMYLTDSLRRALSSAKGNMRAFRSSLPLAEHALEELERDPSRFELIKFRVAVPEDDSSFVLTSEYVIGKLRDTVAAMTELYPTLEDQVEPLQHEFEASVDRLREAHSRYPDEGRWDSVGVVAGKILTDRITFENTGSKDAKSSDFYPDHADLYYRVIAFTDDTSVYSEPAIVGPVQSAGQWFHLGKVPVLAFVFIFFVLTVTFVQVAKKGADLYVRPLAGIEAVDDAIGRATEMGRPILYVLGLGTADMVATIASFTILGRVAKKVAEYQTQIIVPCYEAIVMAVAQEVVKSAYLDAGRPDDYDEDSVHFVTNMQFAYVAAVNGIMLRELPATNIYMGKFFAESLLLAETGALAGSIQIAGTDEIAQIPFFIVACDYTLIGEELYAASAYLGREPILLGSLKAQDWAKAAILIIALVGLLGTTFGWPAFAEAFHVVD